MKELNNAERCNEKRRYSSPNTDGRFTGTLSLIRPIAIHSAVYLECDGQDKEVVHAAPCIRVKLLSRSVRITLTVSELIGCVASLACSVRIWYYSRQHRPLSYVEKGSEMTAYWSLTNSYPVLRRCFVITRSSKGDGLTNNLTLATIFHVNLIIRVL